MKKLLYLILVVALALVIMLPVTPVMACHLDIYVTSTTHWTKTLFWTIDKSVTPDAWTFNPSVTSGTSQYTITVTKDNGTNIAWVDGVITVTNYLGENVGISINAKLFKNSDSSPLVTVPVDVSSNNFLTKNETGNYNYSLNIPAAYINASYSYKVKVDVNTTPNNYGAFSGTSPNMTLPSPTLVNNTINVDDTNGGSWVFSASGSASYDMTFTCANHGENKNTATIRQTQQSDDVIVTVICQTPGISIVKCTNGQHFTGPPGLSIAVGDPVTWTYTIANTGNVPLSDVTVTDSMGVIPAYTSGDTNTDNKLDLTETWIFTASGTAVEGQYHNIGTVVGTSPTLVLVTASDESWYDPPPVIPPTNPDPEVGGEIYPMNNVVLITPVILTVFTLLSGVFVFVWRRQTQR